MYSSLIHTYMYMYIYVYKFDMLCMLYMPCLCSQVIIWV